MTASPEPTEGHVANPPPKKRLLIYTGGALVVGALIVVGAILPAEYNADPLGIGKATGLSRLWAPPEVKVSATAGNQPLARDYAFPWRSDEFVIKLDSSDKAEGLSELEYKLRMKAGSTYVYSWMVEGLTNPEEFYVPPLEVIVLDGSASVDPDGPDNRPVTYEWVITERPEGSTSQPRESLDPGDPTNGVPDDTTTPPAVFFVDLAGTYTAELRVVDNLGLSSETCETSAIVTIVAKPDEAIHIQVVWTTPEDPDQTDRQGTDVDVHLRHPIGDWFLAPSDCYYGNPNGDWGVLGDTSDDPILLTDAPGAPERILLPRPENTEDLGSPYTVGVHGYVAPQGGTVPFTVTIRIDGEIAYTSPPGLAVGIDGFCIIAGIDWPAGTVTPSVECFDSHP
jgi:hypothetical protein